MTENERLAALAFMNELCELVEIDPPALDSGPHNRETYPDWVDGRTG